MTSAATYPGWRTVRLDNGERVQVLMLNPPWTLPTRIEWPLGSGQMHRIEAQDGKQSSLER